MSLLAFRKDNKQISDLNDADIAQNFRYYFTCMCQTCVHLTDEGKHIIQNVHTITHVFEKSPYSNRIHFPDTEHDLPEPVQIILWDVTTSHDPQRFENYNILEEE